MIKEFTPGEWEQSYRQIPNNDDGMLGVIVHKQKCAIKVVATGEHCPETGIHQIDDSEDYLCDRCYENWLHIHQ